MRRKTIVQMTYEQQALLFLVRLGIGNGSAFGFDFENVDWRALVDSSFVQGVSAITVDGLQKLFELNPSLELRIDYPELESLKYEWFGSCFEAENRNGRQLKVLNAMADLWLERGVSTILLKGQANSFYYPEPLHRATGDIDVLLSDYDLGNQVAAEAGAEVDAGWYKHSQIHWKGEVFENHHYLVATRNGKRGKKLDRTLRELLGGKENEYLPDSNVLLPPVMFNALFLTYHSLTHFLSEGIRLKQILDWALFLQKEQARIDWPKFYALCDEFHFRRWVDAMNHIAVNQFGVGVTVPSVVCDSPYAEKILHSVLNDKDFVFSSGKGNWANRIHLITNMFKYSWKYHQIYQESILKQLWYYASGFVFRTEK